MTHLDSNQPEAQQQTCQQAYAQAYAQPASAQPSYAPPIPPAPQKKGRGWIVALVAVILFFVLMFAGLASCTSVVTSSLMSFDSASGELTTGDTIAVIEVTGTIQYDGTTSSPEGLKDQLDIAEANPDIKAVVLRVNSGGGTATAGEEMAIYVRDFSKPVVVSSASLNASAAYEISSQADYIFTGKTTAIGAIGTVYQVTDLSGLYEKLGISVENITSSDSKDATYGTRALSEEERAYYQRMVDQINDEFIKTVAEGRGMSDAEVRALATGLTFTGLDAVENGLADEIGTLEDALWKACELAGIDECDVIYLTNASYDLYSMFGLSSGQGSSEEAAALVKEIEQYVGLEG